MPPANPIPPPADSSATEQISAARQVYEARAEFKGFRVADLRAAFTSVRNPADWTAAWEAEAPKADLARLSAAVEYFHADVPVVIADRGETVLLAGRGLRAWRS